MVTNGAATLHDPKIERTLAATLVVEPGYFDLDVADFAADRVLDFHARAVIAAVANLRASNALIDRDAVAAELVRIGFEDIAAWFPQLVGRLVGVPEAPLVRGWMSTVVAHAVGRKAAIDADELRVRLEAETDEFALRDVEPTTAPAPEPAPTISAPAVRRASLAIEVAQRDVPPIRSYPTGIAALDALCRGGLSTRQMCALLGPPGSGKSALAVAITLNVHARSGLSGLYASTELETHELMSRFAGNLIDRPWSAIARGGVPKEWVVQSLDGLRIRLLGCDELPRDGAKALERIEREIVAETLEQGVAPLVVVDYLQDLARGAERDVRSRVGDIATELRAMSQRRDCALLAVGSVARSFYTERRADELRSYDDPAVYLAAAKECGDVDYASAVVLFLDVESGKNGGERAARIAVAKVRHGEVGFAGARFAGASGRWFDAPESVGALSGSGRTAVAVADRLDDADRSVLAAITKLWQEGKGELCTQTQLRDGCGIATNRVPAALDRLVHVGKLRVVGVARTEGAKTKTRKVYELVGATMAATPEPTRPPLELDLDHHRPGLHPEGS